MIGRNLETGEKRKFTLPKGCDLRPVTDDMALCHPSLEKGNGKLTLIDAEEAWFVRCNHIDRYGTDPHIEALTVHPPEPLLFLNIEGRPGATTLLWEHIEDSPGEPCPNPRVVIPRKIIPDVVRGGVAVDVRRIDHRRWWYDRVLAEDQAEQPEGARVAYDWERLYVLLYRWIDGIDAETACQQGYLTRSELRALYQEVRDAMRERGWDVLDHKARHVIVRPDAEPGRLVRRRGRTLWALVDYELLVPYPAPGAQTLQSQQTQCASNQSRQGDIA